MAEETGTAKTQGKKQLGSQILRKRLGGVPKEVLEHNRREVSIQRKIRGALKDGPKTVPEIHQETDVAAHDVFWHLMALMKYGEVAEGEERDSYFAYALVKGEEKKK